MALQPPKGNEWIFEVKWDGVRALCFIDHGELAAYTRNNNRCERQYPELQVLPHFVNASKAILDGEIAILDERGVSHFELIQPRIHNKDANAVAKMAQKTPAHFFAFDLLYLDGYDLRQTPLSERKKLLAKVLQPHELIRISEHFDAGEELLEVARQNGLEGLIAKCSTSVYESRRSRNWLKLKLTNEQEFAIGGFLSGEREYFGSLAVGFYEDGKFHYAGNVGTGFNSRNAAELWALLEPLIVRKTPFDVSSRMPKGTVFVKPEIVAQVKFANWTNDRRLRAPVYLGLRNDKDAKEVTREVVQFLPEDRKELTVDLNGHSIILTNLDKIYYPEDGFKKRDVLNYYHAVAPLLLPHLKDRPLSLKRYPNGIHKEFFFQKNTPETYPSWLRTESITSDSKAIRYVLAEDQASLLYLTNLGCIDQNPWMSRVGTLEYPDYILIDLDPQECEYRKIVEAALLVQEKLNAIELIGYPKTTGGDGMHIFIPVEPRYTYDAVRSFAEVIARLISAERPDLFTTPRSVAAREKNRVYFDYLQIAESKTISAPYVVRAYPGAAVSTPLEWSELSPRLHPSQFTIANVLERFARKGDLFEGVLTKPQELEKAFPKLQKLIKR